MLTPQPSEEGLGIQLKSMVVAAPEKYVSMAPLFVDLDPTYVRSFIEGLKKSQRRVFRLIGSPYSCSLNGSFHNPDRSRVGRAV